MALVAMMSTEGLLNILSTIVMTAIGVITFFLHFYAFSKKSGELNQKLEQATKHLDEKVSREVFNVTIEGLDRRVTRLENEKKDK